MLFLDTIKVIANRVAGLTIFKIVYDTGKIAGFLEMKNICDVCFAFSINLSNYSLLFTLFLIMVVIYSNSRLCQEIGSLGFQYNTMWVCLFGPDGLQIFFSGFYIFIFHSDLSISNPLYFYPAFFFIKTIYCLIFYFFSSVGIYWHILYNWRGRK